MSLRTEAACGQYARRPQNTIAIAEDIPETQYDYRQSPDSRSVRETLLHIASMTHFDLHIHEEQRRDSMNGFDFREFFAGLPTYGKSAFSKKEILDARESAKSSRTMKG